MTAALLGASNLSLALRDVLSHIVERFRGRELAVHVAHGPGRSYGVDAGVLGLRFRGICSCGLLRSLTQIVRFREEALTWALLTDIGNDILYRSGVDQTLGWVERIVDELLALGARVGITSLPVASIENIPRWKFRLLRPLFYPGRPMPWEEVLSQARQIEEGLEDMSRKRGVALLESRREWYGFDHFHLRAGRRREAFRSWIDAVLDGQCLGDPSGENFPEAAARPEARSHGDRGAQRGRIEAGAGSRSGERGPGAAPSPPPPAAPSAGLPSSMRLRFHPPMEYLCFGRLCRHSPRSWTIAPNTQLYCF